MLCIGHKTLVEIGADPAYQRCSVTQAR